MVRAIHNSDEHSPSKVGEPFTVETATATLPSGQGGSWPIWSKLHETVERQRERLSVIDQLQGTTDQPDYQDELARYPRINARTKKQRLAACVRELNALGLEPHTPFDGSVDFPAVINRRAVCLCWHPSDQGVEYWHEMGEPSSSRQKVDKNGTR